MFWCFSILSAQRATGISGKPCLHPALCPRCPISLGDAEQYAPTAFVSWFLEESILQRAAHSARDTQAQRQLQPTWSGGGINSLQEERQERLHSMALWPELQRSGSAWFCTKLCFSQHQGYIGWSQNCQFSLFGKMQVFWIFHRNFTVVSVTVRFRALS